MRQVGARCGETGGGLRGRRGSQLRRAERANDVYGSSADIGFVSASARGMQCGVYAASRVAKGLAVSLRHRNSANERFGTGFQGYVARCDDNDSS